jgi:cation diffusion facilitator CzcD-associated flavoprotein CzcO
MSVYFPSLVKMLILWDTQNALGADYDVKKHFSPKYKPWEQRYCVAPDGDFFTAIKENKATIKTDIITKFTKKGLLLLSGEEVESDIVVIATCLKIQLLGGVKIVIDGQPFNEMNSLCYKVMMLNRVPNFCHFIGYLTISWTLRSDLISDHFTRLLLYMEAHKHTVFTPIYDSSIDPTAILYPVHQGITSGYLQRAAAGQEAQLWGQCTNRHPWRSTIKWHMTDMWMLAQSPVNEQEMIFS